ncbi:hypothetical protein Plhal304r1_c013g0050161 [Plasmopara halstedii]
MNASARSLALRLVGSVPIDSTKLNISLLSSSVCLLLVASVVIAAYSILPFTTCKLQDMCSCCS